MQRLSFAISEVFKSPFTSPITTVSDLIVLILNSAIAIAGIGLLVLLIGAGISIISSAGSGNTEGLEKAKKTALTAIAGFLVVMLAWFIVNLIETVLFGITGSEPITVPLI